MKISINCRFDGHVIFEHDIEKNTLALTVEAAISARANLARANLAGANLAGAYLAGDEKLVGDRPILQIGPIGSRCAYFVAYLTDKGVRLRAGCFFGTRVEFEERNDDPGHGVHTKEYRAALALIDAHAEIWTPTASVIADESAVDTVVTK